MDVGGHKMSNKKKLKDIIDRLTRAIEIDKNDIEFREYGISRKFNKQELLEYSLKDAFLELTNLNSSTMTSKSIEMVIGVQTLLEDAVFNTQDEVRVGNLQFTKISFLVLISTFVIHQLNAVIKEEK